MSNIFMKPVKHHKWLIIISPILFLFSSCFGVSLEISLNQNGSGIIALEYQVSRAIESLGKLDGNERWNTIPVGREDFERTMDRLPGMKLLSFSSKENEKNLITNAKMEFNNLQALQTFLDAGGRRSSFSGDARSGHIFMTLTEGNDKENAGLTKLLAEISENYAVKITMDFPSAGNLKITNNKGLPLTEIPGSEIVSSGKKVSCSFPLYAVLSSTEGINVELQW